jgi:beta-lactamase regulating signal transducer with metallopeptidase domain
MTPPRDWAAALGQATLAATFLLAVAGALAVLAAWAVQRHCRDSRGTLWIWRATLVWLWVVALAEVCGVTSALAAWVPGCWGDTVRPGEQRADGAQRAAIRAAGHAPPVAAAEGPPAPHAPLENAQARRADVLPARQVELPPAGSSERHQANSSQRRQASYIETGLAAAAMPAAVATSRAEPASSQTHGAASAAAHALHWAGTAWLIVWLVVAAVLAMRRTALRLMLLRQCGRLPPLRDEDELRAIGDVAAQLGYRRRLAVRSMRGIAGPFACGTWRPMLVVPHDFGRRFSVPQQRAIVAHEMAHLAGRDLLWQQFGEWTVALYWWHPAAWWAVRELRTASETRADEASTVVEDGPQRLAECLVQLGESLLGVGTRPRWVAEGMAVVGARFRSTLGRRVVRLLELQSQRQPRQRSGRLLAVAMAGGLLAMVLGLVGSAWARPQLPQLGDGTVSVWSKPWKNSLAGLALLGLAGVVVSDDAPPQPRDGAQAAAVDQRDADPARADDRQGAEPRRPERPAADREGAPRERRDAPPRPEAHPGAGPQPGPREGHPPQGAAREEAPRPGRAEHGEGHPAPRREGPPHREGPPPREGAPHGEASAPRGPAAEVMRRVHHLMVAADNLRAAGFADQAEALRRQAEELRRSANLPMPPHHEEPRGEGPRREGPPHAGAPRGEPPPREGAPRPGPRADGPPPGPPVGELLQAVRQLREEIERLRREVDELRSRVGRQEP